MEKGINVISFSVLGLFLHLQCYHGNFKALDNNNFTKVSQVNELSIPPVVGVIGVNLVGWRAFLRITHEK